MRKSNTVIVLTTEEEQRLEETLRTRTAPYRAVQRAQLILLTAESMANKAIAKEVGMSRALPLPRLISQALL